MGAAVHAQEDGVGGRFGGEGGGRFQHHGSAVDADLAALVHSEEFRLRPAFFEGLLVGAQVFRAVESGTGQQRNRIQLKT
ncbi:hypothetical protein JMUB6875_49530 [Nocardia sp. JMUB6875]